MASTQGESIDIANWAGAPILDLEWGRRLPPHPNILLVERFFRSTRPFGGVGDEFPHMLLSNVNCVLPSVIDTERNRRDMPEADPGKWVKGEDIAEVIYFLASERSRAMHGTSVPVYGLS